MHEFSLVESMVHSALTVLRSTGSDSIQVTLVRFRRNSAFPEPLLRQAFQVLTVGTPLESAAIVVETVDLEVECGCGHRQVIEPDDLLGHMFVCPNCGVVREIDEVHDLELIEIEAEQIVQEVKS